MHGLGRLTLVTLLSGYFQGFIRRLDDVRCLGSWARDPRYMGSRMSLSMQLFGLCDRHGYVGASMASDGFRMDDARCDGTVQRSPFGITCVFWTTQDVVRWEQSQGQSGLRVCSLLRAPSWARERFERLSFAPYCNCTDSLHGKDFEVR